MPEIVAIARDASASEPVEAYRNVAMDLNYLLVGIQVLLKPEFIANTGLSAVSRKSA